MTKPEIKNNFYKNINFDWLESNPIPNEYTKWGNFNVLHETNQHRLKEILETNNTTDEENKLNILWKKGLDVDALNKQNIISVLNNGETDLSKLILERMDYGMMHLFSLSSYTDMKDSTRTVLYFGPAGLGLPDRDYFLLDKMKDKQDAYKDYLKTFLAHCNIDIDYNNVYEFEKNIATVHLPKADCRDPHKIYNKFSFSELEEQFPGIMWGTIFDRYKLPTNDTIILTQPAFFKFMSDHLLTCYKDQTLYDMTMNYLKYRFAKVASTFIDDKSYDIYFDFYCKILMGQKEQKIRWKRVLATIDGTLGEVLSKVYIQKYFGEEQKKSCKAMIGEIVTTYGERIKNLDWMSDITKEKALFKLSKFNVKIGYPDKWTDFSKLIISESLSYFENILECYKWSFEDSISKAYKPVDKLEWHMNAHDINAYYSPTMNEIVFPAGILQEPFYSTSQTLAENLGGIGAVIGHEITHGFDDKGCMFDSDGNLNNWWTDDDTSKFKEKSKKMEDLFASFDYFGINVNGKLTLGENIADLGGITLSLKTLERLVDSDNIKNETKNLFEQWAKIWRCNIMDDSLKNQLLTDPHSPTELRVNGILPNLQEFCDAYDIKMGDKMFIEPDRRSNLW
jgi:putative endopeptidase